MCYNIAFSTNIQTISSFIPNLKGIEHFSVETGPLLAKAQWGIITPYIKTPEQITEQRKLTPNTHYKKTPKQEFDGQGNLY